MSNATEPEDDAHGLLQSLVAEVLGSEASGVVEESGQVEPGTPRANQRCRRLRHHAWARGIVTYGTLVGAMVIARAVDNRSFRKKSWRLLGRRLKPDRLLLQVRDQKRTEEHHGVPEQVKSRTV
jgi:hypothetical protein